MGAVEVELRAVEAVHLVIVVVVAPVRFRSLVPWELIFIPLVDKGPREVRDDEVRGVGRALPVPVEEADGRVIGIRRRAHARVEMSLP